MQEPEANTTADESSASSALLSGRCRQCKAWGAQGMPGFVTEGEGEYRTCIIDLFGDYYKLTVPMFKIEITYGHGNGVIKTHGDFGCPNFNSEFED